MMQLTKQSFLDRWLHIIKEWIDVRLKKGRDKEHSGRAIILGQKLGKGCKVLKLERNTPGAVCTWRFNCEELHEQSLLLTVDNLADVERYIQRVNRQNDPTNTNREVVHSIVRGASHRIAISLINSLNRTEFIGVWDANFIDKWANVHAEDYKAERISLYATRMMMAYYEIFPELFENEVRTNKNWWEQRILNICQGEFPDEHDINFTCQLEAQSLAK